LELLHDETVSDRTEARTAVAVEVRAEETHRADRRDEMARKRALAEMMLDDRQDLGRDPVADRVPDHALLVVELRFDVHVVETLERCAQTHGAPRRPTGASRPADVSP